MIICGKATYKVEKLFQFLKTRQGKLDGVVFTGGEASLHPNIVSLAKCVKDMGFKLKLDTNGTRPKIVQALLKENLLDYIAIDYKATPKKFKTITHSNKYKKFSETLNILCNQNIPFEVRTTVHTDLLNEKDVQWIIDDLEKRNCKAPHYIQNYMHTKTYGNLKKQDHHLNLSTLTSTKIKIDFRNF